MDLFIRYHSEEPDEFLDDSIVDHFHQLGFQCTFSGYDLLQHNRDLYFERHDPFDDMDSGVKH